MQKRLRSRAEMMAETYRRKLEESGALKPIVKEPAVSEREAPEVRQRRRAALR